MIPSQAKTVGEIVGARREKEAPQVTSGPKGRRGHRQDVAQAAGMQRVRETALTVISGFFERRFDGSGALEKTGRSGRI